MTAVKMSKELALKLAKRKKRDKVIAGVIKDFEDCDYLKEVVRDRLAGIIANRLAEQGILGDDGYGTIDVQVKLLRHKP